MSIVAIPGSNKLYEAAIPNDCDSSRPDLFLWPCRTLFIGPFQDLVSHSLGSVAINVGLYRPFQLRIGGGQFKPCRYAIIPAGCKHEISAFGSIVASFVIEKNSPDYMAFESGAMSALLIGDALASERWVQCFRSIYEQKPANAEITRMLNQLLQVEALSESREINIDRRIGSIMTAIDSDPDAYTRQQECAASVGLSSSRFRHLFREQSDIPFRRYRMWRRVMSAIRALNSVDNLTQAAMEAGFSDAAHFNRCFRDSFGVNPSLVFKNIGRFEV